MIYKFLVSGLILIFLFFCKGASLGMLLHNMINMQMLTSSHSSEMVHDNVIDCCGNQSAESQNNNLHNIVLSVISQINNNTNLLAVILLFVGGLTVIYTKFLLYLKNLKLTRGSPKLFLKFNRFIYNGLLQPKFSTNNY